MNIITIAGNIGRDAELRHIPNGEPVASFTLADSQGRDKATVWWRCNLWGRRGEALAPYLLKGAQVTVIGSVTERAWTDKEGQERKSMEVRVTEIALQGGRREGEAAPGKAAAGAKKPNEKASGFDDMDDDIPF